MFYSSYTHNVMYIVLIIYFQECSTPGRNKTPAKLSASGVRPSVGQSHSALKEPVNNTSAKQPARHKVIIFFDLLFSFHSFIYYFLCLGEILILGNLWSLEVHSDERGRISHLFFFYFHFWWEINPSFKICTIC